MSSSAPGDEREAVRFISRGALDDEEQLRVRVASRRRCGPMLAESAWAARTSRVVKRDEPGRFRGVRAASAKPGVRVGRAARGAALDEEVGRGRAAGRRGGRGEHAARENAAGRRGRGSKSLSPAGAAPMGAAPNQPARGRDEGRKHARPNQSEARDASLMPNRRAIVEESPDRQSASRNEGPKAPIHRGRNHWTKTQSCVATAGLTVARISRFGRAPRARRAEVDRNPPSWQGGHHDTDDANRWAPPRPFGGRPPHTCRAAGGPDDSSGPKRRVGSGTPRARGRVATRGTHANSPTCSFRRGGHRGDGARREGSRRRRVCQALANPKGGSTPSTRV